MQDNNKVKKIDLQKAIPLALILIPFIILGIFMLLDEKEHASVGITEGEATERASDSDQADRNLSDALQSLVYEQWGDSKFTDLIESIDIYHRFSPSNNHRNYPIASISKIRDLEEPQYFTYNLNHVQPDNMSSDNIIMLTLNLKTTWNQQLMKLFGDWLEVEGADYQIRGFDNNRTLQVNLTNFEYQDIYINILDAQPISLNYTDPMEVVLTPEPSSAPWFLLMEADNLHNRTLVLTEQIQYIDLTFSEQMVRQAQVGESHSSLKGSWQTTNTYRLEVEPFITRLIQLNQFNSLSGNQVHLTMDHLPVIWRDTSSVWLDTENNYRAIGAHSIYDAILYAPNNRGYLGIIYEDGDYLEGGYYTLIYERQGEKPLVIRQRFYTNVQLDHVPLPVEWLNNHEILVYTSQGIEKLSINQTDQIQTKVLFQTEPTSLLLSATLGSSDQERLLYLLQEKDVDILSYAEKEMILYSLHLGTGAKREIERFEQKSLSLNRWGNTYHTSVKVINHHTGLFIPYYSDLMERRTLWIKGNERLELEGHPLFSTPNGVMIRDQWYDQQGSLNQKIWWINTHGSKIELDNPAYTDLVKVGDKIVRSYPTNDFFVDYQADLLDSARLKWIPLENSPISPADTMHDGLIIYVPPFIKNNDLTPFRREVLDSQ